MGNFISVPSITVLGVKICQKSIVDIKIASSDIKHFVCMYMIHTIPINPLPDDKTKTGPN